MKIINITNEEDFKLGIQYGKAMILASIYDSVNKFDYQTLYSEPNLMKLKLQIDTLLMSDIKLLDLVDEFQKSKINM